MKRFFRYVRVEVYRNTFFAFKQHQMGHFNIIFILQKTNGNAANVCPACIQSMSN